MARHLIHLVWLAIMGGLLVGCSGGTGASVDALPLDAEQPTLLYFYTDN